MKTKFYLLGLLLSMFIVSCNQNGPEKTETSNWNRVLSGVFSVSGNTKVKFSPGNLQFQASTFTWRFAEHQYDFVGADVYMLNDGGWIRDKPIGNVYYNTIKCDNRSISSTYPGWIDLFGWGTGFNPTLTSKVDADYRSFTDWGLNTIGSDPVGKWRTLSVDEWRYILMGRNNSANLYAQATVNNVTGILLLPDQWSAPNGIEISYGENASFINNVFTLSQWEILEKNGAIFLPASGDRIETSIYYIGEWGHYWASTEISYGEMTSSPGSLDFRTTFFDIRGRSRYHGCSVRLVQDVK